MRRKIRGDNWNMTVGHIPNSSEQHYIGVGSQHVKQPRHIGIRLQLRLIAAPERLPTVILIGMIPFAEFG